MQFSALCRRKEDIKKTKNCSRKYFINSQNHSLHDIFPHEHHLKKSKDTYA